MSSVAMGARCRTTDHITELSCAEAARVLIHLLLSLVEAGAVNPWHLPAALGAEKNYHGPSLGETVQVKS